jgi:hypothetical protein
MSTDRSLWMMQLHEVGQSTRTKPICSDASVATPLQIGGFAAHFTKKWSEMREECGEAIERTPSGRCNRRVEGIEMTKRLLAKFAPSGIATPLTGSNCICDLVASDAGIEMDRTCQGRVGFDRCLARYQQRLRADAA